MSPELHVNVVSTLKLFFRLFHESRAFCVNACACASQAPQPLQCGVCLQVVRRDSLLALPCQHSFCKACWEQHCTVLVKDGVGVGEWLVFALRVQCVKFCHWVVRYQIAVLILRPLPNVPRNYGPYKYNSANLTQAPCAIYVLLDESFFVYVPALLFLIIFTFSF